MESCPRAQGHVICAGDTRFEESAEAHRNGFRLIPALQFHQFLTEKGRRWLRPTESVGLSQESEAPSKGWQGRTICLSANEAFVAGSQWPDCL